MLLSVLTALALAQATDGEVPEINGQLFRPSIDADRFFWTDDSGLNGHGPFTGRVLLSYHNDPLLYRHADGDVDELISDLLQVDVLAGYTLFERVRIGLNVPIYARSWGAAGGETGLGDISLDLRASLLDRAKAPLGVALAGRLFLPTTTVEGPLGNRGMGFELQVIADVELADKLLLAANVGAESMPSVELENTTWGPQLMARLGAGYALTEQAGIGLDLVSGFTLESFGDADSTPIEGILGGWGEPVEGWVIRGGVGTGFTTAVGVPKLRLIASIGYEPPKAPTDTDGDGIIDDEDQCPAVAEDRDGVADTDGCAETTSVTVRLMDPDGVELMDGTWEIEGATGLSGESTGLFGGEYPIALAADGYLGQQAVAAIPDAEDHTLTYTLEPDILTGSLLVEAVNQDGAKVDNAGWKVLEHPELGEHAADIRTSLPIGEYDVVAQAPGYRLQRRTVAIVEDETEQIRFELEPARAEVTAERIDIRDSVYFETNKDVIKDQSHDLLDEVALILVAHPELALVRIEGHTDARGGAEYNKDLSQRRADAVLAYLVKAGVDAGRLTALGFGEERPLVQGSTPAAYARNRRVDFFVAERND